MNQIFVERENQIEIVFTQRILFVVAEGSGEKSFFFLNIGKFLFQTVKNGRSATHMFEGFCQ